VKLSHKLGKLFQAESYARLRRRLRRRLHPVPLEPLLARLDQNRMREIEERYRDSDVGISKYARVPEFMKMNIERVQDLDLHRRPPMDILDLGCGGGFFLYLAQQYGHRCVGLDVSWFPVFGELIELMGVDRRIWEIKAFEPLPDLGRKFDLITAYSTGFNRKADKTLWGPAEWDFFLNDLTNHLKPDGSVFFGMNPQEKGWYYSDELRDFFLSRGAEIERERVYFPRLTKRPGQL
jgi:SAM-dependent methyltransferase